MCSTWISIHALREESDLNLVKINQTHLLFQSTLSVRRATTYLQYASQNVYLFQSTLSVRRATWVVTSSAVNAIEFQSTLSVRRATCSCTAYVVYMADFNPRSPWGERPDLPNSLGLKKVISIHALREESDRWRSGFVFLKSNFNPRSPWGERLRTTSFKRNRVQFQSTLSVRRATK